MHTINFCMHTTKPCDTDMHTHVENYRACVDTCGRAFMKGKTHQLKKKRALVNAHARAQMCKDTYSLSIRRHLLHRLWIQDLKRSDRIDFIKFKSNMINSVQSITFSSIDHIRYDHIQFNQSPSIQSITFRSSHSDHHIQIITFCSSYFVHHIQYFISVQHIFTSHSDHYIQFITFSVDDI